MSSDELGYLPATTPALPGGLTLERFIQSFVVGVSGYTSTFVRPRWQAAPPKQPDITQNWIACGIQSVSTPGFAYIGDSSGSTSPLERQEKISILLSFYGPDAYNNATAFRDGCEIRQNLDALATANMGFFECTPIIRAPELVNERWFERVDFTLVLVRRVQRTYQILSFVKAEGTIHTVVDGEDYNFTFETPELEE